mgnify:CR=1 FL=1
MKNIREEKQAPKDTIKKLQCHCNYLLGTNTHHEIVSENSELVAANDDFSIIQTIKPVNFFYELAKN